MPASVINSVFLSTAAATVDTLTPTFNALSGDLVIALLAHRAGSGVTTTIPTDWSGLATHTGMPGNAGARGRALYRVLTSDLASQAFTIDTASDDWFVGVIVVRGQHATPFDHTVPVAWANAQSSAAACPDVTTTVANTLILRLVAAQDATPTVDGGYPASHTGLFRKQSEGSLDCHGGAAWQDQAVAGATGTATFATSVSRWLAATIVIQPAAAAASGSLLYQPTSPAMASLLCR